MLELSKFSHRVTREPNGAPYHNDIRRKYALKVDGSEIVKHYTHGSTI